MVSNDTTFYTPPLAGSGSYKTCEPGGLGWHRTHEHWEPQGGGGGSAGGDGSLSRSYPSWQQKIQIFCHKKSAKVWFELFAKFDPRISSEIEKKLTKIRDFIYLFEDLVLVVVTGGYTECWWLRSQMISASKLNLEWENLLVNNVIVWTNALISSDQSRFERVLKNQMLNNMLIVTIHS